MVTEAYIGFYNVFRFYKIIACYGSTTNEFLFLYLAIE